MARTVTVRSKSNLPGGGFDASGNPKNAKQHVVGAVTVSSYSRGGESLTAADLGLVAIDWIELAHENEAGGQQGSAARRVLYNRTSSDFYIWENNAAGGEPMANASAHTVYFSASGDSLAAPEST